MAPNSSRTGQKRQGDPRQQPDAQRQSGQHQRNRTRGARDFLMKPAPLAMIASMAADLILQDSARPRDVAGVDRIIGRSSSAIDLRATLRRLASAAEGQQPPGVLLTGPRGKALTGSIRCCWGGC